MLKRKLATLVGIVMVGGLLGAGAGAPPAAGQDTAPNAFCTAVLDLYALDPGQPTPNEKKARALKARVNRQLEKLEAAAPAELAANVGSFVVTFRQMVGQKPPKPGQGPPEEPEEFVGAEDAVNEYLYNNCGFQTAEVAMIEYEFQGIPKTLKTGTVAFKLTNPGAEVHELIVVRMKTSDAVRKLIRLPEKEFHKRAEVLGGNNAEPGETRYAFLKLIKPGNYGALCFFPVGSTPEAGFDVEGPPHTQEGMYASFEVTKA